MIKINFDKKIRNIQLDNKTIPCYFFNYFKSPGLIEYPALQWVNDDYNLIKAIKINQTDIVRIATNLWKTGNAHKLFETVDFFVMMPLKKHSLSNLPAIICQLATIIKAKNGREIKFITDLFTIEEYLKFWENRLTLIERKKQISNKISLKTNYFNAFNQQHIILIDDVIATGTSLINIGNLILHHNDKVKLSILCYGSVYGWEQIYC